MFIVPMLFIPLPTCFVTVPITTSPEAMLDYLSHVSMKWLPVAKVTGRLGVHLDPCVGKHMKPWGLGSNPKNEGKLEV